MRIEHEPERRFFAHTPSGEAELSYVMLPQRVMDLRHTFVPEQARGEGLGGALVQEAFGYARANGHTVLPSCPFARAWAQRHPEQGELLASSG
jgi:uncharacterized protein